MKWPELQREFWQPCGFGAGAGFSLPFLLPWSPGPTPIFLAVAVPASSLFFLAVWRFGVFLGERAGMENSQAQMSFLLRPLGFLCLSPLAPLISVPAFPLFLATAAASVSLYRTAVFLRQTVFASRPDNLARWLLFLVFLLGFVFFFQVNIIHDAFQYYGYLASLVLDRDLHLYDQIYIHNAYRFYNPFPLHTGRYIGTAVFEFPFFLLGHLAALILNSFGKLYALNGYSEPYLFAVSLVSSLFGLVGLGYCSLLARVFFPQRTALIAVVAVWLASPLVFFMYAWNGWAHPFTFALTSAFLYYWQTTRQCRSLGQWLLLGMILGGIVLVRPGDGLIFMLPALETLWIVKSRASLARPRTLLSPWVGPILCLASALLIFSPQFSLWHAISGHWLAAPYKEVGDFHDWLHPQFNAILFATAQHGLFSWNPLLLPASLGIVFLRRHSRLLCWGAMTIMLATLYLYASWSIWWSGVGFSNRFFINLTPFFILGLGAGIERLGKVVRPEWICAVLGLAILCNVLLMAEYRAGVLPHGIPDPFRATDYDLGLAEIGRLHLATSPTLLAERMLGQWLNEPFFLNRLVQAVKFGNGVELGGVFCLLTLAGLGAFFLLRLLLGQVRRQPARRMIFLPAATLAAVLALHAAIVYAGRNTSQVGDFSHVDEINFTVYAQGEPFFLYPDYPLPVTGLDILSSLAYGHAIPQDAPVAEITVYDESGVGLTKLLRAGKDIAESSFPRPEYRETIQHGLMNVEVARSIPTRMYSRSAYEFLVFRAVMELPRPMVVKKIGIRYMHPLGKLIVSDVFLRDFASK